MRFDIRQATRELALVLSGLLVANAAFYALAVRPRLKEYGALTDDSAPLMGEVRSRQAAVEAREKYLMALVQTEGELERLRTEILSTRDRRMISVDEELADLATQFDINLNQVQYENEILPEQGLERFAMVVPLKGGYANLRKFIRAVEDSDKFLVIERVALAEGEEGGVILQLNITLVTYFDVPELQRGRRRAAAEAGKA